MASRFVEALRQKQIEEGLTQAQFAAKFEDLSQGTLSRLYSGTRQVGMDTFQKVVKVYPELAFLFLAHDIHPEKAISPTESSVGAADAP